jgi:hypothetical protein
MLHHVYKKMNIFEKFKLYRIKRMYTGTLKKMDRAIVSGDKERAYMYEDKLYECDEMLEGFIKIMNHKYV